MALQYTPYTLPLALAFAISTLGAWIAWRQREGVMEFYGLGIQLGLGLWALVMLLTVSSESLVWKRRWLLLIVPTIAFVVVTCFLFTLRFTGRTDWITPRRRRLLFAYPLVCLAISATNGVHGLVLVNPRLDTGGSFVRLAYEWGPAMYAIAATYYGFAATYIAFSFQKFLRSRNVYRNLSFVIFVGFVSVTAATVLSLAEVSPFPHFVLGPLTYVLVGAVLLLVTTSVRFARKLPIDRTLSVASSRFNSTVPLARDFVVQEVDNGILVLDSTDRIVDINSTARKMLGLDRPVGKRLAAVARTEQIISGGDLVDVLEEGGFITELEEEIWVQTDRGPRCYDVSISALTGGTERGAHVVLLHDITQQKENAERLEAQKAELETQKRQLELQNERLDRFASIVSHDLRNPLNVVDGYLELLQTRREDGSDTVAVSADELESMVQATTRMERIIDDALTLARQGKAITEAEVVSLETVARTAWEHVDTREATLAVTTDWSVEADRDRLLTVFENLFRNAVEHGGPTVTVRVGRLDGADGFFVADDGPGIDDARKADVFDRGFTTNTDGTGLGLAIVRHVVEAHGWSIAVADSTDGGLRVDVSGVTGEPVTPVDDAAAVGKPDDAGP